MFSGALWFFWTTHVARLLHCKKHLSAPVSHEAAAANECERLVPQSQRERTLPVLRRLPVLRSHRPRVPRRLAVHSHPLLRPGHKSGHPHRQSKFRWTINNWSQVGELKPQKKSEIKELMSCFRATAGSSFLRSPLKRPTSWSAALSARQSLIR